MSGESEPRTRSGMGLLVPAIRLPRDYRRGPELRALARDGVAGFIVFGGDRELLPAFLGSLRDAAGRPILVMTDAERGVGQQVDGCLTLPPLMAVGATLSEERAYEHGRATALEARAVGINMLLAPVADVLSHPQNPIIGNRSFGANPVLVAALTAAWVTGAQEQGVLACVKHFPGHGDTAADSHETLPVVEADTEVLRSRELLPFIEAIHAGVGAVMTAHVAYPSLDPTPCTPASLSAPILGDLLRGELGFGGLVVSDALTMAGLLATGDSAELLTEPEAAVRCVAAGCDLLLHPTEPYVVADALEAAAAEGRTDTLAGEGRLRLTLADLIVERNEAHDLAAKDLYDAYGLARDSLTALRNEVGLLPLDHVSGASLLGLLVDDDDDRTREQSFRERREMFTAGFTRLSDWSGEREERALLDLVVEADLVLLAVACAQRAWKGRPGLKPSLVALVDGVLERAGNKTVCLLLSTPGVLAELACPPRTVVAAWGDAPVSVRAALDVLLSGRPMRGLDPAPSDGP